MAHVHGLSGARERLGLVRRNLFENRRYALWLVAVVLAPVAYTFTRFMFWLDRRLFPRFRAARLDNPVFIMGHPRSGTSFLQQRIAEAGMSAMFTTWQIAFPSLIGRRMAGPIVAVLRLLGLDVLQDRSTGHEIRLDGVEEEEALFAHLLDTDLVTYAVPWLLSDERYVEHGNLLGRSDDTGSRDSMVFFRECLLRHAYHTGIQPVIVKVNPLVFRLRALLEVFPDAKIVYIVREPDQAIRSFFSFVDQYVATRLSPEEHRRFFEAKYRFSADLYQRYEDLRSLIPTDRQMTIQFSELTANTEQVLARLFDFAGIEPERWYWQRLRARLNQPRKKAHRNRPLSRFPVSVRRIRRDLAFVWSRWIRGPMKSP